MKWSLLILCGSIVWAAPLAGRATAQEYSNGGTCQKGRKAAILTPVEAYGVHPPGLDPADAHRFFHRWRHLFIPYYAPLSPVASSARWKPWCYFPLMPYYTPYYIGYCPHRLCHPQPAPYGTDGWGKGPMPEHDVPPPGALPLNYGPYTSVIKDDTIFWNMGGNGLTPYGAPRPPRQSTDLVDMIQGSRAQGFHGGPGCQLTPEGAVMPTMMDGAGPVFMPPSNNGEMLPTPKMEEPPMKAARVR